MYGTKFIIIKAKFKQFWNLNPHPLKKKYTVKLPRSGFVHPNHIIIHFDNCRIVEYGKLCPWHSVKAQITVKIKKYHKSPSMLDTQFTCLFYAKLRPQHVDVRSILFSMMAKICILSWIVIYFSELNVPSRFSF
jgi:hypothetical protein